MDDYTGCTCHCGNPPCSYCVNAEECEYCGELLYEDSEYTTNESGNRIFCNEECLKDQIELERIDVELQ